MMDSPRVQLTVKCSVASQLSKKWFGAQRAISFCQISAIKEKLTVGFIKIERLWNKSGV